MAIIITLTILNAIFTFMTWKILDVVMKDRVALWKAILGNTKQIEDMLILMRRISD